MFTGIVEAVARVTRFDGVDLLIEPLGLLGPDPIDIGESIAVNGCCLTVVDLTNGLKFNLSPETIARTSFAGLAPGGRVNLERAMRANGRFGGHIVQGHVDATASVVSITPVDGASVFQFRVDDAGARYLIDKGSIAIDGISLTVVRPDGPEFEAWIIPHTLANTNLGDRRPGDRVNVEYDMLARYAERLLGVPS